MTAKEQDTIRPNGRGYIRIVLGVPYEQRTGVRMRLLPGQGQVGLTAGMNVIQPQDFLKKMCNFQAFQLTLQLFRIGGGQNQLGDFTVFEITLPKRGR